MKAVAWRTVTLDLEGCDRVEFVTVGPKDAGHWPPGWPEEIRAGFGGAVARWQAENPGAVIAAVTGAAVPDGAGRSCVMVLHFRRRI